MKKTLILMLMTLLTACSCFDTPEGDFCDRYIYPSPSLSETDKELAAKVYQANKTWATAVKTNRGSYKKLCME